jgi:hypothetical protein
MARYLFIISFFLLHLSEAHAADRSLIKIKTPATGMVKISASEILTYFPEYSNKNPRYFHLFKNGIEQAYLLNDTSQSINNNTVLYFYAERNDGHLDKLLYDKAGANFNPYHSIYSDTSIYFLMLDESAFGKYYKNQTSITPVAESRELEVEQILTFAEQYHFGKNFGSGATQSEYTLGEGYAGATWGLGATQNRAFMLPSLVNTSKVRLETFISGQSDAQSANPNFNHHVQLNLQGTGNLLLLDTQYKAYQCVRKSFQIDASNFSANNTLQYISVNDLGAASDFNASSYIKLNFTQTCNIEGKKVLGFSANYSSPTKQYLSNVQLDSMLLFNSTKQEYYKGNVSNDSLFFNVSTTIGRQACLAASIKDADVIRTIVLEKIVQIEFDFSNAEHELILLSSKKLAGAVQQVKQYKDNVNQVSLLVYVEDLYNSYSYGHHHPIAIKLFIDDYLATAKKPAKNIFIIGKGIQSNFYRDNSFTKRDLVPIIGIPPSDALYVSSVDYSVLVPRMGIGRIAVETEAEVLNYLDKLIEYEANSELALWNKNIIHATGGRSISENDLFSSALKQCEAIAIEPLLGAKVINFNKRVNEPVSDNFREKILALTNEGINLLSYYGHGANYFVEINFGEPEALSNKGKYPIYFLNGCSVGNTGSDNSLGENYINAKNRGAIGWLASSDLGFPSYLTEYDRLFYKKAFKDAYGKSIGEIQKETISEFIKPTDSLNILHTRQFFYQGDPSIRFYSPAKPDFRFNSNGLFLSAKKFNTNDSVELAFIINNPGKAISDSVEFLVQRNVNNQNILYPIFKKIATYNIDTVYYTIPRSKELSGNNTISIQVNPNQKINEENVFNNTISKEFYFASYNPVIIRPRNNAVLKSNRLTLVVQCSDLYATDIEYSVELDTSANFNTNFKKTFTWIEQQSLLKELSLGNISSNTNLYVRVKIKGQNQESDWLMHQFVYLPENNAKWLQKNTGNLNPEYFDNIKLENNTLQYIDNNVEFAINTRGDQARTDSVERRMRLNNNAPVFLGSGITGICLLALEPNSLTRFSYASTYNLLANTPDYPFEKYKYSGVYVFNTNSASDRDSLLHYLNSIPNGYVVGGYNGLNANLSTLPEPILQALEQLGLAKIRTIPNGEPYAFVGYKGSAIGTAAEKTSDPSIGIDPLKQFIRLNYNHVGKWDRGSISSDLIGPANKWKQLKWSFNTDLSDEFSLDIIGIDTNGNRVVLQNSNSNFDSLTIESINAKHYPFLQLRAYTKDSINFSPAGFNYWASNYVLPVEISVFPQYQYLVQPNKTQQGDSIKYQLAYVNLSEEIIDTAVINLHVITKDRTERLIKTDIVFSIQSLDTVLSSYKIDTRNFEEEIILRSSIKTQQIEGILYNNVYESKAYVGKDTKAPLLRVSIDGKIPMQNDLVSPRPLINIKLKDENPYLLLNDSSYLSIELKKPNESAYKSLSLFSSEVQFTPATSNNNELNINYQPYFNVDGMYSLRIKVKDASNNTYANNAYTIDFEVVNASTITHFLPYPNPFTTHTQFVFTLTGESIPDDLKIQIMTISGKVVREISKAELGNLKIGHNISEYKWNGTDEYGNRLANGVYLYRVLLKSAQSFDRRSTSADKYFNAGFGKLYMMK